VSTAVSIAGLAAHFVPARELEAREQRQRLSTGIAALDEQLGGGWPRGAVVELCAARGHGRTAVLLTSLAAALARGEAAALVDFDGAFDPRTAQRAGLPLQRLLWVRAPLPGDGSQPEPLRRNALATKRTLRLLAAAEAVVAAGGFGMLALDFGERTPSIPSAAWLRLRRVAGAPGTVVLAVTLRPLPGLLASTSVALHDAYPLFHRTGPALLEGLQAQPTITRNLGGRVDTQAAPPPECHRGRSGTLSGFQGDSHRIGGGERPPMRFGHGL
jgi:hypothetical protein